MAARRHGRGQLLFAHAGSIRLAMPGQIAVLPPIRVAWIPPGTEHRVLIRGEVEYRSIYLDLARVAAPAAAAAILLMTPLLREVFERISLEPFGTDWSQCAPRCGRPHVHQYRPSSNCGKCALRSINLPAASGLSAFR